MEELATWNYHTHLRKFVVSSNVIVLSAVFLSLSLSSLSLSLSFFNNLKHPLVCMRVSYKESANMSSYYMVHQKSLLVQKTCKFSDWVKTKFNRLVYYIKIYTCSITYERERLSLSKSNNSMKKRCLPPPINMNSYYTYVIIFFYHLLRFAFPSCSANTFKYSTLSLSLSLGASTHPVTHSTCQLFYSTKVVTLSPLTNPFKCP